MSDWKAKTEITLKLAKELGNIYTGSLFNCLYSIAVNPSTPLEGKTVMMFSYGSGNAASMFLVRGRGPQPIMREITKRLER